MIKNRVELERLHKKHFGGNREIAIQRDAEKCVLCGFTRKKHFKVYGSDITVDHIDGKGINSKVKNHNINNLQTLCIKCHTKKDVKRYYGGSHPKSKLTENDVLNIFKLRKNGTKVTEIVKLFNISSAMVYKILSGQFWKPVYEKFMRSISFGVGNSHKKLRESK